MSQVLLQYIAAHRLQNRLWVHVFSHRVSLRLPGAAVNIVFQLSRHRGHGGWDVSWRFERSDTEASNVANEAAEISGRTFVDGLNRCARWAVTSAPDATRRVLQLLKLALVATLRFFKLACERAIIFLAGAFSVEQRSRLSALIPVSIASLLQDARNAISANSHAFNPTASRTAQDECQRSLALTGKITVHNTASDSLVCAPLSDTRPENATPIAADQAVAKFPFSPNMFAESKTKLKKNSVSESPNQPSSQIQSSGDAIVKLSAESLYSALSSGLRGRRDRLSTHEFTQRQARLSSDSSTPTPSDSPVASSLSSSSSSSTKKPTGFPRNKTLATILGSPNHIPLAAEATDTCSESSSLTSSLGPATSSLGPAAKVNDDAPARAPIPFNANMLAAVTLKKAMAPSGNLSPISVTPNHPSIACTSSAPTTNTARRPLPFDSSMLAAVVLGKSAAASTRAQSRDEKPVTLQVLLADGMPKPNDLQKTPIPQRVSVMQSQSLCDALANSPLLRRAIQSNSSFDRTHASAGAQKAPSTSAEPSLAAARTDATVASRPVGASVSSPSASAKEAAARFGVLLSPSRPPASSRAGASKQSLLFSPHWRDEKLEAVADTHQPASVTPEPPVVSTHTVPHEPLRVITINANEQQQPLRERDPAQPAKASESAASESPEAASSCTEPPSKHITMRRRSRKNAKASVASAESNAVGNQENVDG